MRQQSISVSPGTATDIALSAEEVKTKKLLFRRDMIVILHNNKNDFK